MVDELATSDWCEALYREHAPKLVLFGRAMGLGHGESEDIVHEVFIALVKLAQPPQKPGHYLVRAFRNRVQNHRRSLFRRVWREFESKRWFEKEPGVDPVEGAAMAALVGLPREQREVIVLKIWHERTFEEIGELLEVSPNTAAGRYRYGLQKLRTALGNSDHESTPDFGGADVLVDAASPVGAH